MVLFPKKPFFDWLISIEEENKNVISHTEGDVYLLPDYEIHSEIEQWLKKHFDDIFTDQLNNWYVDESLWPAKRTFSMFNEWFSYTFHTTVYDTEGKLIKK